MEDFRQKIIEEGVLAGTWGLLCASNNKVSVSWEIAYLLNETTKKRRAVKFFSAHDVVVVVVYNSTIY